MLDLDDQVLSVGGWRDLSWERFEQSFEVFGQLVSAWLAAGVDVVAHGPFFESNAMDAVLRYLPTDASRLHVVLLTSYEVALQRVAADPGRDLSRDPDRLRAAYLRAMPMLEAMPPCELTFDTTNTSIDRIVDALVARVSSARPGGRAAGITSR